MKDIEIVAAVTKGTFEALFEFIIDNVGDIIKDKYASHGNKEKIKIIQQKVMKLGSVKTLLNTERAVPMKSFYCPPHVKLGKKRIKINDLSDFGGTGRVLIEGLAGQGKSMLVRHLCITEALRGGCVPVFVELRKISKSNSLKNEAFKSIRSLELAISDKVFDDLACSGRLLLAFDGLDEVSEDMNSNIVYDIEHLAEKYPLLKIIVSSRPDSALYASQHFELFSMDDLKGDEYTFILEKLIKDSEAVSELVEQINASKAIKACLCTPLMVGLMVIRYRNYRDIPSQFSEFYGELFNLLLNRHDGMKLGFTRERKSSLNDLEMRRIFECLSYYLKKYKKASYSYEEITEAAEDAIKTTGKKDQAHLFLNDILKITCLIIKDGVEHRFLHKTIQEYHVASYIQRQPQEFAENFYSEVLEASVEDVDRFRSWMQELRFLDEIDKHRFNKFYHWCPVN